MGVADVFVRRQTICAHSDYVRSLVWAEEALVKTEGETAANEHFLLSAGWDKRVYQHKIAI